MEYMLVYRNGLSVKFRAEKDTNAVKKAFRMLGIEGRIKNVKFYDAGAREITFKGKKIFPIP